MRSMKVRDLGDAVELVNRNVFAITNNFRKVNDRITRNFMIGFVFGAYTQLCMNILSAEIDNLKKEIKELKSSEE